MRSLAVKKVRYLLAVIRQVTFKTVFLESELLEDGNLLATAQSVAKIVP